MTKPATKKSIRESYIANLQETYPFYTEGSRPLELAREAIDAALNGFIKVEGACMARALAEHGLPSRYTLKMLSLLPEQ